MPKYVPTEEDIYPIKHCALCGSESFDENRETCSEQCGDSVENVGG